MLEGLPLLEPPNERCAACPRHDNVITASHTAFGRAGLSDRFALLSLLANIAGTLCARLVVDKPCRSLTPKHNLGLHLGCDVEWGRYFTTVLTGSSGDESAFRPPPNHHTGEHKQLTMIRLNHTATGDGRTEMVAAQYLQALRMRNSRNRFHWRWDGDTLPLASLRAWMGAGSGQVRDSKLALPPCMALP